MTNPQSNDSKTENVIQELHQLREAIVDSFGGDLHALTTDARQRQNESGKTIWKKDEHLKKGFQEKL